MRKVLSVQFVAVLGLVISTLACGASAETAAPTEEPLSAGGGTAFPTEQIETATEVSSVGPAATAAPVDPCTILTQADAESMFGGPSQPGQLSELALIASSCAYTSQSGDQTLMIVIWRFDTSDEATGQLSDTISSSLNPQEVPGLGEHAITSQGTDPGTGRLAFTKGPYFVDLAVKLPVGVDLVTALTPVAQAILKRLP